MTETISARLTLPPEAAQDAIRAHLALYDVDCAPIEGGLTAEVWGGSMRLLGNRMILTAPDTSILFVLQEGVAYALDQVGGEAVWDHVEAGGLAPNVSLVVVESVTQISPIFRRVRVRGDVSRFDSHGLHFRLLIPPEGVTPEWPRIDEKGRARWPEGKAELHRPAFTTRAIDVAAGWLDFDVFLHDGARTTEWTKTAAGKQVGLIGPGGGWLLDVGWVGLFGDETALPAIARMLEALPAHATGVAVVKASDLPDLPRPAGVALRRVDTPDALIGALRDITPPATDRYLWLAGEKTQATEARAIMKSKGVAKTEMVAAAYWAAD